MSSIAWLKSKIAQLFSADGRTRKMRTMASEKESGTYIGAGAAKARNFDEDYNAAINLLKDRMHKSYPDNYYARLSSAKNSAYDYGEERASAVDVMSSAIAMALRNGATVQQAATAGAASVGI